MKIHPWNQMDRQHWIKDLGMNTDTKLEQCSVCKGKFKKLGLKIHQTTAGCAKQLSDSHRNKNKLEASSTQDTNHSDASGRVSLKTTRRGNGAQFTGAMGNLDKVTKEIRIKKWRGRHATRREWLQKKK